MKKKLVMDFKLLYFLKKKQTVVVDAKRSSLIDVVAGVIKLLTFLRFSLYGIWHHCLGPIKRNQIVIKLRGCSVKLQGSLNACIQDNLVFLICLMCWDVRLFLK